MKNHHLKTWPEHFSEVFMGRKTHEVRINDRDFQVGDYVHLEEFDPTDQEYTGRKLARRITHILHGGQFGIQEGYVVLSIQ